MKIIIILLPLLFLSLFSHAERFDIETKLGDIRIYDTDNTINVNWRGAGFVVLPGISESPSCAKHTGNYVAAFDASKSEIISLALAAKMADREVIVTIDDSIKYPVGDFCVIQFLTIK